MQINSLDLRYFSSVYDLTVQGGEYAVHCQIYRENHGDFSLDNIKLIFSMKNVSPPVQCMIVDYHQFEYSFDFLISTLWRKHTVLFSTHQTNFEHWLQASPPFSKKCDFALLVFSQRFDITVVSRKYGPPFATLASVQNAERGGGLICGMQ